jgi:Chitobiase/beta-hexosaminidase C-terminal domain
VFASPAPAPTFTPMGGDYTNAVSVTLTSAWATATLQYSTNGTFWTNYSGPLTLTNRTTLLARTIQSGYAASVPVAQHFLLAAGTNATIPTNGLLLRLSADTGVEFDGERVSRWRDQSGQGYHAEHGSPGSQPLYVTNGLLGRPVIRFDGTNDLLFTQLVPDNATYPNLTIYTVERIRSINTNQWNATWSADGLAGNYQRGLGYWTTNLGIQQGDHGGELNVYWPGVGPATNTLRIVGVTFATNDTTLHLDGTNYAAGWPNIGDNAQELVLGGGYLYDGQHSALDLAEVLVYNRALSAGERSQLEAALRRKYWDTDGDLMPDAWETANSLDPLNPADGAADPDGDKFSNRLEYMEGTDPHDDESAPCAPACPAARCRTTPRVHPPRAAATNPWNTRPALSCGDRG